MLKSFLRPICHFAIVLAAFAVGCGLSNAEDPRSLVDQGKEAFSRGDLDGALVKFNEAVRRSPENVDSHWWRARANWNKGLVDQAIADVTTVIKLGPPQAKAYNIRGSFYLSKGDTARAIGDFTEAIRLAPNDPTIYNNRGAAYLTAENLTRAIDDLSEAIRLDRAYAAALANRGLALVQLESYEAALVDLDESLRIKRDVKPLQSRAIAHFALQHRDKALADLDEAIRLGADLIKSYRLRAKIRSEGGDDAGGLADLTSIISLEPKNPDSYLKRARFLTQQRQYEKAMADVDVAIAIDPKCSYAFELRAALWIYRGDTDRGSNDIETAMRFNAEDMATNFDYRGNTSIAPAEIQHGWRQVARMLHDRPEMERYPGNPLEEWAARKFAGEDLGRPIYWDSTEPPSFTFGENHVRPGERGAIIRVSKNLPIGKDKGTPQSFDQLWSSAVFELNNVANSSDYRRIDEDASKGKLARSEYVQRIWQCEWRAVQKTRAFYIRCFLPWARLRHVPSHPEAWYLAIGGSKTSYESNSAQRAHYEFQYDQFLFRQLLDKREFTMAYQLSQSRLKASVAPEERAVAYCMCGTCLIGTGRSQAAVEFFNQAIKANRDEPLAYIGRGAARSTIHDFNGAIEDYSEAIRLSPLDACTYLVRADVYRALGDSKRADADTADALRLRARRSDSTNEDDSRYRQIIPMQH